MNFVIRGFITCLFIIGVMGDQAKAQTIFTESFEGSFPPAGWTIINAGSGNPWMENTTPAYSFSGLKSMQCPSNGTNEANTWAITQSISLLSGRLYRISYWYREVAPGRIERLKVTLGNAASIAAQTTLLHDYTDISNLNNVEGADIFSVATDGNYHIGFHCYSTSNPTARLVLDSIVLQQVGMQNCSGIPSAGTVQGPSSVCSGTNFTMRLSGNYYSAGYAFQWQSSPASANNFTDIAGATGQAYATSQTSAKDYRCVISCSNGGASSVSSALPVSMRTLCYCGSVNDCSLGYISNVTIGTLNNHSTCSSNGYMDYTGYVQPVDLLVGSTVPISVTPGGIALTQNVGVWIDYNRNNVFESTEYKDLGSNYDVINNTVTINAAATPGPTYMRVKSKSGASMSSTQACNGFTYGETEDYPVNLVIPACTGTPAGGTTTSTVSAVCPDINFTVKVSGATTGFSGLQYQWQKSGDGLVWTDLSGAVTDSLITTQSAQAYYRRKTTCSFSSQSAFSVPLLITSTVYTSCYCTPGSSSCTGPTVVRIDSVGFGSINNISGCDGVNGYSDYTATVPAASIQAGTYVPMRVKLNSSTLTRYLAVAIDCNRNGLFDRSETTYASGTTYINLNVRVPFTNITGPVRMRVRVSYFDTQPSFCFMQNYGEAEDYMVNLTAPSSPGPNFSFYVNPLATGNGNGLSWANAFTSLTTALNTVLPSDTIRVARATYSISGSPTYFNVKDSVVMLGGYPNTGNPTDALRSIGANETILNGSGASAIIQGGNAFTLDGFILQGIFSTSNSYSAIRLTNSSGARIRNCVIRNNSVSYGIGSSLRITNSNPVISNCIFVGNRDSYGSTVLCETNSTAVFNNCIFYKNTAGYTLIEGRQSTLSLNNCTIVSNKTDTTATVFGRNNATVNIRNTIFFNNSQRSLLTAGGGYSLDSLDIRMTNATLNISNTMTQIYDYGNIALLSKDPKFRDSSSVEGPDNKFFTADDGLQLNNPCSPAMNAGSNALAAGISTDMLGNNRIVSSSVDLGAYEVQSAPQVIPKSLYVNKNATGNGSGLSWADAMTDLQAAMKSCSDTIRVAAGTYYPDDLDEKKSVWLENKRVILGGYPATGNPTDAQRNPSVHLAILSGQIPNGNGNKTDILIRGRKVDSTSVTDGLVLRDAESAYVNEMGAIYLSSGSNPVFKNCSIINNLSEVRGAGVFITHSVNPKFLNCIFDNNRLTNIGEGGAAAVLRSRPEFRNCIFRNNSNYIATVTPSSGGAVYNNESPSIFDSCTFLKNTANNWGGAMDNVNCNPVISNCKFLGNLVSTGNANDIHNVRSAPVITNTLFSDSTGCNYGGSVVNKDQSNGTFIGCEFRNGVASFAGGAVYNENSSPTFLRCVFYKNGSGNGGAMSNVNGSHVQVINCVAANNSALTYGSFMHNSNSNPTVINTTIANGTLPSVSNNNRGGVIVNQGTTQLTISNSVIWGNTITSGSNTPNGDILDLTNPSTPTVMNHCITQYFGTTGVNGNQVGFDPWFLNMSNPPGPDNVFFSSDDGLNISACSPAVNAGSNTSIAGHATDILGNNRVFNSIVDLGAFEVQSIPSPVTNTWTGAVSNVWENPLNWSLGHIPDACSLVSIGSGSVVLHSNTTIYSLTIAPSGVLTVSTGFTLTVLH